MPVTINMGFGIRSRPTTPLMPLKRLKELGVRARHAAAHAAGGGDHAACARRWSVMKHVIETGEPVDRPDLARGIEDIMALMDYDEMRELERRLLTTDVLQSKYSRRPDKAPA